MTVIVTSILIKRLNLNEIYRGPYRGSSGLLSLQTNIHQGTHSQGDFDWKSNALTTAPERYITEGIGVHVPSMHLTPVSVKDKTIG